MLTMRKKMVCVLTMLLLICSAASLQAQPAPGGGGGGGMGGGMGGGPGGGGPGDGPGGPPDPQQMQQMTMDRLQREMGISDDDFQALAAKIQKVMQLKRDSDIRPQRPGDDGGPGGDQMGQGGPGDNNDGPPRPATSAIQTAADALHKTITDKSATPDDVKAKVDALRQAKVKARSDLLAAQQDLQKIVTPREEAALVELGLLE
jgi:hypothetical protein